MKFLPLRLATLAAAALLFACNDAPTDPKEAAPQVSYADDYVATVDSAVSIEPVLSGGPATRFRVNPRLPDGLALDTATGRIHGTPEEAEDADDYRVIAVGPGGADTATFSLQVLAEETPSTVSLALGLKATTGYTLSRLIVEYASGVSNDSVIRDTILPGMNGFEASSSTNQTLLKAYALKPLRDWKIRVRAYDASDSLMYRDSAEARSLLVGETRPVTMTLEPRFRTYAVKFLLPDSIGAQNGSFKLRLSIHTFKVFVDGVKARDTLKAGGGYFAPSVQHLVPVRYVPSKTAVSFGVHVSGDLVDWPSAKPLYADTLVVNATVVDSQYTPTLQWTGPGSAWDPQASSNNPGGSPIQGLTVLIGIPGTVTIEPGPMPEPLPKTLFKKK